jgi:uncharacterized membrane protein
MKRKIISIGIMILVIPVLIISGTVIFNSRHYALITLIVATLSCVPFLISFERRETNTRLFVVLAVLIALNVAGRFAFSFVPGFKPVTAMVILTAMYFGPQAGFLTGALTAVISNFYFGQGAWTPFQMFVWGFIGLLAGLIAEYLKKSITLLAIFGIIAGALFSLLMDVWTALWWDGTFVFSRYLAVTASALPITALYAASNLVFLLVLAKPIGKKLERIKNKYNI